MLSPATETYKGNCCRLARLIIFLIADAVAFGYVLKNKPADSTLYLLGINAAFVGLGFCLY